MLAIRHQIRVQSGKGPVHRQALFSTGLDIQADCISHQEKTMKQT
uniref:Uncharacterized protein n=1 Tax=Faecalibaculum rodentium TaxID=1702221 RepID=A0A140DV96_9FIRM|nr:hypothetical protein AALO17_14390 [Faecalibaculum rodentium]